MAQPRPKGPRPPAANTGDILPAPETRALIPSTPWRDAQIVPPRQRIPCRVAATLIDRINQGVYTTGSRLPTEARLIREFGISRAALREALIILQCRGLIETQRSAGARVLGANKSPQDRFDASVDLMVLLEACCVFEVQTTALAAGLPGERGLPAPVGAERAVEAFRQFHVDLAGATGNGAIVASVRNLWDLALARSALRALLVAATRQSQADFAGLQGAVIDAVRARDPQAAREAVRRLFSAYLAGAFDVDEATRLRQSDTENQRRRSFWKDRLTIDPPLGAPPPATCGAAGVGSDRRAAVGPPPGGRAGEMEQAEADDFGQILDADVGVELGSDRV